MRWRVDGRLDGVNAACGEFCMELCPGRCPSAHASRHLALRAEFPTGKLSRSARTHARRAGRCAAGVRAASLRRDPGDPAHAQHSGPSTSVIPPSGERGRTPAMRAGVERNCCATRTPLPRPRTVGLEALGSSGFVHGRSVPAPHAAPDRRGPNVSPRTTVSIGSRDPYARAFDTGRRRHPAGVSSRDRAARVVATARRTSRRCTADGCTAPCTAAPGSAAPPTSAHSELDQCRRA